MYVGTRTGIWTPNFWVRVRCIAVILYEYKCGWAGPYFGVHSPLARSVGFEPTGPHGYIWFQVSAGITISVTTRKTVSRVSFCGDITVKTFHNFLFPLALAVGLEPTTIRLTADCATYCAMREYIWYSRQDSNLQYLVRSQRVSPLAYKSIYKAQRLHLSNVYFFAVCAFNGASDRTRTYIIRFCRPYAEPTDNRCIFGRNEENRTHTCGATTHRAYQYTTNLISN